MFQKINQFKRKYIFDKNVWAGEIYLFHILGLYFDKRKWYYFKSDYVANNRDWKNICWFLEYEVTIEKDGEERIDPDCERLPWHWRFAYAIKNWYMRKPLAWIAVGWLLRAVVRS